MTDPTHPEELLAGHVEGTLTQDERALVDAHLATCAVCREEVDLAREALTALAALEERPVPFGVTGPVLAEAGRRFERRRAAVWERVQWAAGLAAAAALVLVVALNLGGDSGDRARPAAEGAGGTMDAQAPAAGDAALSAEPPALERQRAVSYDDAGVRSLTHVAALEADAGAPEGQEDARSAREERNAALECLRTSGAPLDEPRDTLVRLIEAQYLGTPAYFAVFHESPGAGQPPDSALVWVAATSDCRILTIASQSL